MLRTSGSSRGVPPRRRRRRSFTALTPPGLSGERPVVASGGTGGPGGGRRRRMETGTEGGSGRGGHGPKTGDAMGWESRAGVGQRRRLGPGRGGAGGWVGGDTVVGGGGRGRPGPALRGTPPVETPRRTDPWVSAPPPPSAGAIGVGHPPHTPRVFLPRGNSPPRGMSPVGIPPASPPPRDPGCLGELGHPPLPPPKVRVPRGGGGGNAAKSGAGGFLLERNHLPPVAGALPPRELSDETERGRCKPSNLPLAQGGCVDQAVRAAGRNLPFPTAMTAGAPGRLSGR